MSKREVKLYLTDIDDSIATILSYTVGITYEQLLGDRKTREAIILQFRGHRESDKENPSGDYRPIPRHPLERIRGNAG